MLLSGYTKTPLYKLGVVHLLCAFAVSVILQPVVFADEEAESLQEQWDQVSSLRRSADFNQAVTQLLAIIEQYSDSDTVLREAYSQLVWTYLKAGDMNGAEGTAREALGKYPDISANETYIIPGVNRLYEQLRREMFGSLQIEEPKEGRVFLNEEHMGDSPLFLNLVRVGEYDLLVTKAGYEDYVQVIKIEPDQKLSLSLSMTRTRDWKWWSWRVGAAVVAASALAVGLSSGGGGGGTTPDEPLPGPPAPPAN